MCLNNQEIDNSDQPGAGFTKEPTRHRPGAPAPQGLHHISREVSRWEQSAAAGFLVAKRMQAKIAQWFLIKTASWFGRNLEKRVHRLHGKQLSLDLPWSCTRQGDLVWLWFGFETTAEGLEAIQQKRRIFQKAEGTGNRGPILQHHKTIRQLNWQVLFQRNETSESIWIKLTKTGSLQR